MERPFAEREFELGVSGTVTARIFLPVARDGDYCCDYEVIWPTRRRVFHAYGIDGVQAIMLALAMVKMELETSPEAKTNVLTWLGGEDLGLVNG